MHLIATYAPALLLFSSQLVTAVPNRPGKRTFSISETPVVRSPAPEHGIYHRSHRDGPLRRRKLLHGTGGVTSAKAGDIQHDTEYLVPVTIGGSEFNLQLDTGSADLWVYSEDNKDAGQHPRYKPSKEGRHIPNSSWVMSYADGTGGTGVVYSDTVSVGSITVKDQGVGTATYVSSTLAQDSNSDGIIGLGFGAASRASPPQKTFFENALDQLEEPVFTADLRHDAPGTYDFGFIDDKKYTGDITYVDVDPSAGYWGFKVDELSYAENSTASAIDSIADTGTTLLVMTDDIAQQYLNKTTGVSEMGGLWVADCDAALPDLTFTISGHKVVVPGNTGIPVVDGKCYTPIQAGAGSGPNVIGDVFFKSQFVVFKMDRSEHRPQLGFANKRRAGS